MTSSNHIALQNFLTQEFGILPSKIKRIDGYDNANYIVYCETATYIFKTYAYEATLLDILDAENKVLSQLTAKDTSLYPTPIPFVSGDFIKVATLEGARTICRMLSFMDGQFIGDIPPSKEGYQSLG